MDLLITAGLAPGSAIADASLESSGHLLDVTVLDAEGNILSQSTIGSGELYGFFGHTEVQWAQEAWRTLNPGDLVLLQGQYPVCPYGLCHTVLGATARITGADILYYSPTYFGFGYSLRTYLGGIGFVPK